MKAPEPQKIIGFAYLAGFILVLFIIYKLLSAVGIIKTGKQKRAAKERQEAVASLRTEEYFNPDFYRDKKFKSIGSNAAILYAQQLRKSMRGLGTDEEAIYSVFGKLMNKCNISEVAAAYYNQYKRDLQTDLNNELTDRDTVPLMEIINGLPNF